MYKNLESIGGWNMQLKKDLLKAFNEQIQKEYASSYIYTDMELYFKKLSLKGFERFFNQQSLEERQHAEQFVNFVFDMEGDVELKELEKPGGNYKSILDVFEQALAHEKFVTKSITELLELARKDENYAAENFLRRFIDEQVEEEAAFQEIVDTIKFLDDDKAALFSYNVALGQR